VLNVKLYDMKLKCLRHFIIFVGYCNLLDALYSIIQELCFSNTFFLHNFCCIMLNVNYIDTRAYFVSGIVFARQRNVISYLISCKSAHSLIVVVNVINVVCSHLRHSTHDYTKKYGWVTKKLRDYVKRT